MVDAEAVFQNLNRNQALRNISNLIPHAYMSVYNMYNSPSEGLYNKQQIRIEEGTIQGCSLSTAVYDLGIKPLLEELEC